MWGNKTLTPIERPAELGGARSSPMRRSRPSTSSASSTSGARDEAPARRYEAGANVGGYGSYWLDAGDTVLSTGQTSLIIDPPDGRARIRQWALDAKQHNLDHNSDDYRHMSVWDRCISRGVPGSMLPAGYTTTPTASCRTPDHFVIQHEMIHDVRIIRSRTSRHIDANIRQWMANSRARWEGDTLVVESRNFHNRGWIASSAAGRRLKGHPHQQGPRGG